MLDSQEPWINQWLSIIPYADMPPLTPRLKYLPRHPPLDVPEEKGIIDRKRIALGDMVEPAEFLRIIPAHRKTRITIWKVNLLNTGRIHISHTGNVYPRKVADIYPALEFVGINPGILRI